MSCSYYFFFNDTATTEIYTLSLHDALPILGLGKHAQALALHAHGVKGIRDYMVEAGKMVFSSGKVLFGVGIDRKSTRLNSSHANISYAVFCLKKKKKTKFNHKLK